LINIGQTIHYIDIIEDSQALRRQPHTPYITPHIIDIDDYADIKIIILLLIDTLH
jgi:hypothetical protein